MSMWKQDTSSNSYHNKKLAAIGGDAGGANGNMSTSNHQSRMMQQYSSSPQQSDLYALVVSKNQYPQLMQAKSWNLAVPFVEQRFSHTPSESIANNFTPTANKLKIRHLSNIRTGPPPVKPRESRFLDSNIQTYKHLFLISYGRS